MKFALGFIAGIIFTISLAVMLPDTTEKVYNCEMAEWSPDIPEEVRKECRKRRKEHLQKYLTSV